MYLLSLSIYIYRESIVWHDLPFYKMVAFLKLDCIHCTFCRPQITAMIKVEETS